MGLTLWANPVIEQQAQHRREENAKSKNTLRLLTLGFGKIAGSLSMIATPPALHPKKAFASTNSYFLLLGDFVTISDGLAPVPGIGQ